jgi:hypothetical protein
MTRCSLSDQWPRKATSPDPDLVASTNDPEATSETFLSFQERRGEVMREPSLPPVMRERELARGKVVNEKIESVRRERNSS